MRPVDIRSEKVQLGAGLTEGVLAADAIERGLDCLSRFAQMLESVDHDRIRVVGTNALRIAKNRRDFTEPARAILGTRVDVVYGREEARLVYLGVAHTLSDDASARLVIDIGGGSTELVIGERFEPQRLESLQMGCVSFAHSCFTGGNINPSNFHQAYAQACIELSHIRHHYQARDWEECVGSSGTLNAIEGILVQNGWSEGGIQREGLTRLEQVLLDFDTFDAINLDGLSSNRRNVIAPGVAITSALFDVLRIESIRTSKGALREGVIYDLMGRLSHEDVRERTINALMQRYAVDEDTATIVSRRARILFTATRMSWQLDGADWEQLHRVARTHEIGMAISHKHFNRHSAYLLRNADLPGFSQEEQEQLAVLALGHRGKLDQDIFLDIAEADRPRVLRLVVIMRLAALLKYVEHLEQLPDFTILASENLLTLDFPDNWLEQHPLTATELNREKRTLEKFDIVINVS